MRSQQRNAGYFAEKVSEAIRKDRSDPTRLLITGFKNTAEVNYFARDSRFKLIALEATYETCLARWRTDDDAIPAKETDFERVWNRDYRSDDKEFGQDVCGCIELASIRIENNASKRALLEQVEQSLGRNQVETV